jgi:glycosyltransferase involved in cell wall biosynthesis
VDLILTDSHATAQMYKEQDGIDVTPIGPFIDPTYVIAKERNPQNVLLVNPSLAKGAAIVIRLAMMLETERPDITFEVVQSRGDWEALVRQVSKQFGKERSKLSNVIVTPNTADMRPIYARTRVLLALSLWWESFGRVAAEAAFNGIRVIAANRGGLPEAAGNAAQLVTFPQELHAPPYNRLPPPDTLSQIKELLTTTLTESTLQTDSPYDALKNSTGRLIHAVTQVTGHD